MKPVSFRIDRIENYGGFDYIVRGAKDIKDAIKLLIENSCDQITEDDIDDFEIKEGFFRKNPCASGEYQFWIEEVFSPGHGVFKGVYFEQIDILRGESSTSGEPK